MNDYSEISLSRVTKGCASTIVKVGEDGVAEFRFGFLNRLSNLTAVQANLRSAQRNNEIQESESYAATHVTQECDNGL